MSFDETTPERPDDEPDRFDLLRGWYMLNEAHQIVRAKSIEEWAEWFESDKRQVKFTQLGSYQVSTVFLGIDHGFGGPPKFFETMGWKTDRRRKHERNGKFFEFQFRYSTYEQAVEGHTEIVRQVNRVRAHKIREREL